MSRDWTVSEHLDTKSIVEVISCTENHATTIFVKWRPFGRSTNGLVMDWIPLPLAKGAELQILKKGEGINEAKYL